jgi:hypothetical protein
MYLCAYEQTHCGRVRRARDKFNYMHCVSARMLMQTAGPPNSVCTQYPSSLPARFDHARTRAQAHTHTLYIDCACACCLTSNIDSRSSSADGAPAAHSSVIVVHAHVCVKGDTLTTSLRRQCTIYVVNTFTAHQCVCRVCIWGKLFVCAMQRANTCTNVMADTRIDMNLGRQVLILHAWHVPIFPLTIIDTAAHSRAFNLDYTHTVRVCAAAPLVVNDSRAHIFLFCINACHAQ